MRAEMLAESPCSPTRSFEQRLRLQSLEISSGNNREKATLEWTPKNVKTLSALRYGETAVRGAETIVRLLPQYRLLGLHSIQYYLNHPDEVPKEWCVTGRTVCFDATPMLDNRGVVYTLGLQWIPHISFFLAVPINLPRDRTFVTAYED